MAMTREDGTLTAGVGKDVGKEGPAKKKNAILELLRFAGKPARLGICRMRSFGVERRAYRDASRMRVVRCS